MFGREKMYKQGMADALKANEVFSKKQEEALNLMREEVRKGNKSLEQALNDAITKLETELGANIKDLYKYLNQKEKEALYHLVTPYDLKDLSEEHKRLLLAALYQLANDQYEEGLETTSAQQNYIRSIKKYLEIANPQAELDDLSVVGNIDSIAIQKVFYQVALEYFYLHENNRLLFSQEQFLSYFVLRELDKVTIEESVCRCLCAAGPEGIAEKYGYVPEEEPEQEENKQAFEEEARQSLNETIRSLGSLEIRLSFDGYFEKTTVKIVSNLLNNKWSGEKHSILEPIFEEELKDDIKAGAIKAKAVADRIEESMKNENGFVAAYKFIVTDENFEEKKYYFFIITDEGFFFFLDCKIAFIKFDDLKSVKEARSSIAGNSITISARQVIYYEEDGTEGESDKIVIEKNNDNKDYLRGFRKGLEHVIEKFGGTVPSAEDEVAKIVEKYIHKIPKGTLAKPYLVKDFMYDSDDSKNMKRLKNALAKYARKVRKDDVIGFIDISLFDNGNDGILFAKDGLAFDYAFEKIFVKYEEIDNMSIKKGKDLYLHGDFHERKDDFNDPSINSINYNLDSLKECLEEIQCVI